MATQRGFLSTRWEDGNGVQVAYPTYLILDDTATLADVITFAQSLVSVVNAASDAAPTSAKLTLILPPVVGWNLTPATGTTVSKNVALSFFNSSAGVPRDIFTDLFPAPKNTLFTNGRVNLASTEITNIKNAYTTSVAPAVTDEDFVPLLSLKRGYKSIRKHRRAELRASQSQIVGG